jgi:hypothetical protein
MSRQPARNGAPIHFALFRVEVEYGFCEAAAVKIAGADKEEALSHVRGDKRKRPSKQSADGETGIGRKRTQRTQKRFSQESALGLSDGGLKFAEYS